MMGRMVRSGGDPGFRGVRVAPLLAVRGTAADLSRAGWIVDEKINGWRALCYRDGGRAWILSREGSDLTAFAGRAVVAALLALPLDRFIVDAELCAGEPVATLPALLAGEPRRLVAFDLLYGGDIDARPVPLSARRESLSRLLRQRVGCGPLVELVRSVTSGGEAFYRSVIAAGGEGVVVKDPASEYVERRSKHWRKFKPAYEARREVAA